MKKITKLLVLCVCLILAVSAITATAYAADVVASGTCGDRSRWTFTDDGVLTISGAGKMSGYIYDQYPWVEYAEQIKRIVIGKEISGISSQPICATPNLTFVEVEEGSEYFVNDDYGVLFSLDGSLYRAPATLEGTYEIPYGVKSIENYAFNACTRLTNIIFPDCLRTLKGRCFTNCTGLTSLSLPGGLDIYEGAFVQCPNLHELRYTGNAPVRQHLAYEGLTATIYYPANNETWNSSSTPSISGITWKAYTPDPVVPDDNFARGSFGSLFWSVDKDYKLTISGEGSAWYVYMPPWAGYADKITAAVIEDGVTAIPRNAFYKHTKLTDVTIPDSVTAIGDSAFYKCTALKSVTIPPNLTELGNAAFWNCSNLVTANIPDTITRINDEVFIGCSKLNDVTIPDSVTEIGYSAFSGCSDFKHLVIPGSVVSLDTNAFRNCSGLESITLSEGLESIGDYCFYNSGAYRYLEYKSIIIPSTVTYLGHSAFRLCKFNNIVLSGNIDTIYEETFRDSRLESIVIPSGVKKIVSDAFSGCRLIETIRFEGDLPEIEENGLAGLQATGYYPEGNSTWTDEALKDYGGKITWKPYTERTAGDVNLDGDITNSDLILVARYIVDLLDPESDDYLSVVSYADMDDSGSVTNADLISIARIIVGLE